MEFKMVSKIGVIFFVMLMLPGQALAEDQAQRFKTADLNGDGYLDAAENAQFIAAAFSRADLNKDGFLDRDEIFEDLRSRLNGVPEGTASLPPSMMLVVDNAIKVKDKDGDGKVSLEEFKLDAAKRFKKLDVDGDGRLTLQEMLGRAH